MADGKVDGETGPKKGTDYRLIAGIIIILAAAAAAYVFLGQPPAQPPEQQYNGTAAVESPEAQLLFASFDAAAAAGDYNVSFVQMQDGIATSIREARKGDASWIWLEDVFATREGFFGGRNTTPGSGDVVCLSYRNDTRCAAVENNGTLKVANSLRAWEFGNPDNNMAQKEGIRALMLGGAIRIEGPMSDATIGPFDTERISYLFDMENLTVSELVALGVSPNDPSILIKSRVTYWIDKETGLAVKTSASRTQNGILVGENSMTFSHLELDSGELPAAPEHLVDPAGFVRFYSDSQDEFMSYATCGAQPTQTERDSCYKTAAASNDDWEYCRRIVDRNQYESCTLIVAQQTNNYVLCGQIEALADDCYISVAGQTGDFELCRNLKDRGLSAQCLQAAAEGKRKADEAAAAEQQRLASRNCQADSDCSVSGGGMACVPNGAAAAQPTNESLRYRACFENLPCGCNEGFCGFAKNEAYYQCLSGVEQEEMEEYIDSLPSNSTNSSSS